MKCPICDGGGRITSLPSGMPVKCTRCHGTGEVEMTNEEWFCQLPTGEKAEFFANIYPKSVGEALIKISNGDKDRWLEWLMEKCNE